MKLRQTLTLTERTRKGRPHGRLDSRRTPSPGRLAPAQQARHRRAPTSPRSAVACVDVHNHLGRWLTPPGWTAPDVDELLALMDRRNVATVVNLDGMHGDELEANLSRYDRAHPTRFVTFCQLDWSLLARPDGEALLAEQLRDCARRGARGLKVWKNLGLTVRDADGTLVLPDDERVVRTLALAGTLGLPVLIHVADPVAFFDPVDAHNERIDELRGPPGLVVRRPVGAPDVRPAAHGPRDAGPRDTGHHVHRRARRLRRGGPRLGRDGSCARRRTGTSTSPGGWPSSDASRAGPVGSSRRSPTACCSAPTRSRSTTRP